MRRKDLIHQELERLTGQLSASALRAGAGIDAESLGRSLGLARTSVSMDLNALCQEGKALKIKSRPVLFLHKERAGAILDLKTALPAEVRSLADLLSSAAGPAALADPFQELIGYDQSLKQAVEKGKAAVLYPPNGLNVMLTGPPGVGKTYFAELMHRFKNLAQGTSTPSVYFNCSEYFNNPELLASHLFGHQQGAFTGATNGKEGLVAQAEGGVLFLDEVHRLPFEGQEKLFSILDKGVYRRLGSSGKEIDSHIRLICATTENIKSAMLSTFLRRIQVVIDLPSLAERSFDERLEMIMRFFQAESRKTGMPFKVGKTLLGQLLGRAYEGNVGELKSVIQFLCAQAYAHQYAASGGHLRVEAGHLDPKGAPYDIRTQLLLDELLASDFLEVAPNDVLKLERTALMLPPEGESCDLFYSCLIENHTRLQGSNIPANEISLILRMELQTIFSHKIHHAKVTPLPVMDGVFGLQIEQKIKLLVGFIQDLSGAAVDETVAGHLRNHFVTLLAYLPKGRIPCVNSTNLIPDGAKAEYDNARLVCRKIEETFMIACPSVELIFHCLLLSELKARRHTRPIQQDCGVVLITHGATTSSSMAEYVGKAVGREVVTGINLPFEQSVHDTLALFLKEVAHYPYRKLVLAVDLGSLVHFAAVVRKMFKIETLLIRKVTLNVLLDVANSIAYETSDLGEIRERLALGGVDCDLFDPAGGEDGRVIVISCATGHGTAEKIRKMIEDVFEGLVGRRTRLVTLPYDEIEHLDKLHDHIGANERLAGIIGSFQPMLPDVPFLSLEELFSENGAELVLDILDVDLGPEERKLMLEQVAMKFISTLTIESIINQISVLNPTRVVQEVEAVFHRICQALDIHPTRKVTLRFMIHCCCMVERIVIDREPLRALPSADALIPYQAFSAIKGAFAAIEAAYNIQLSDTEYYYIHQLLFN